MEFDDQLLRRVNRSRKGYTALAATIDLLAIRSMTSTDPREARQRLNDLQGGVSASITLYPGGADYRVCFAGDSVFLVQELEPEVDGTNAWANFCGHIFAISCLLNDMDRGIENPGLRVIIAAGSLLQITDPDSWKGTPWAAQSIGSFSRALAKGSGNAPAQRELEAAAASLAVIVGTRGLESRVSSLARA